MKVRCTMKRMKSFGYGKSYDVISVDDIDYRLVDDDQTVKDVDKDFFEEINDIKMKKRITKEQSDFLIYVRDNHLCMGYGVTIPKILKEGYYFEDSFEHEILRNLIEDWKRNNEKGDYKIYGSPIKYNKI